ncbi:MAG: CpaF family protein [Chloroflexi bacterium]|nr:CpaF family protein [Chloroflexota bacterium]MBI3732961.1 CpaF family protein [Chloroflexota bacterium]
MSLLNRISREQQTRQQAPAKAPAGPAAPAASATPTIPPVFRPEAVPAAPAPYVSPYPAQLHDLARDMIRSLSAMLDPGLEMKRTPKTLRAISEKFLLVYQQAGMQLNDTEQKQLFDLVVNEVVGFGPIQPLLDDPTVSEVMVNGPEVIYFEQKGKLYESDVHFEDDEHVMRVVERIVRPLGRRVDRKVPMVDARLPDGSRVNIVVPPAALNGPVITIRKFPAKRLSVQDLIAYGSMTSPIADFLQACVASRLNIVVSGGTGSGKTTLLNVLSSFIPETERITTIEDAAELQLQQKHVVRLEAKPAELDGTGAITIRDLVKNSLRMRPDRIIVGEVRDGAALDMLQAMNTGHDGSLTTVHANTPREATKRLETLALMAGFELPLKVIREQIAGAVDLIIQQARLGDGSRRITYISEVGGMEGDVIILQDIFKYTETGRDMDGRVLGEMRPTGLRPHFSVRLEAHGFRLGADIFGVDSGGAPRRY